MSNDYGSHGWTRREALGLLGMGLAAAALPVPAIAQGAFPRGAIIRTILKDYAPEELAGGATLFHEHMSFADDFMARWMNAAAETRAANNPAPAGGGAGGAGGPPTVAAPPAAPGTAGRRWHARPTSHHTGTGRLRRCRP